MADEDRWARGAAKIKDVYAGDVVTPPKGAMAFSDIMIEQLFGEVWTRDVLSMRDRRLLLLGAIAALGEPMTFGIQSKAALKNEELDAEQLRECLIFLTQYVGYPRAAGLVGVIEKTIQDVAAAED